MVSIIIPVYNSGSLLNKCLNSVVKQTFVDWEIVLVNDCSSDERTRVLLKQWATRDNRIRVINKVRNEGIEKARFTGLEYVKGDYLMFMGHDDWLCTDETLEVMMESLYETNADVVMGRSYEQILFYRKKNLDTTPRGIITQPELKEKYYISFFGVNILPVLVWGKIYKMDVIKRARLHPCGLRDTDDVNFNMWVFPYVEKLSVIDDYVYVHRWGGFSSKLVDFIPEYKKLYAEREKAVKVFGYPKGLRPMRIQMKNLLMFDLSLKIERKNYLSKDIVCYLEKELDDKFWDDVMEVEDNSEFMQALRNKDYLKMYDIVREPLCHPKRRICAWLKRGGRWILRLM